MCSQHLQLFLLKCWGYCCRIFYFKKLLCWSREMFHINQKNHCDYMATISEAANYQIWFLTAKSQPFLPYHTTLLFLSLHFPLFIFSCFPTQSPLHTHFHLLPTSFTLPTSTLNFNYSSTSTGAFLVLHFLLFSLLFPFFFLISLSPLHSFNGTKIQSRKGQGREEEEGRKR